MSAITLQFPYMESTVKHLKNAGDSIDSYREQILNKVIRVAEGLPGKDIGGHINSATGALYRQRSVLAEDREALDALRAQIKKLLEAAKTAETKVIRQLDLIVQPYKKGQGFFRAVIDEILLFTGSLSQNSAITRFLNHAGKVAAVNIGNYTDMIVDYYKYGKGQYIWNMIKSITGTVLAIVGVFTAIAAVAASGGLLLPVVLGILGAAASAGSLAFSFKNTLFTVESNMKAYALHDSYRGAAKFYSRVDSSYEYYKRRDMGDQNDNDYWESVGKKEKTAKLICDVVSLATGIASKGYVYNKEGQVVDFNWKGVSGGSVSEKFNNQANLDGSGFSFTDKNGFTTHYTNIVKGRNVPTGIDNMGKVFGLSPNTVSIMKGLKKADIMYKFIDLAVAVDRQEGTRSVAKDLLNVIGTFTNYKDLVKTGKILLDSLELKYAT